MAFVARLKSGGFCAFALLVLSVVGCASVASSSPSISARQLDDGCGSGLVNERGLTTYSQWVGETLEVTYFAIHDAPLVPGSAHIDALSAGSIRISYQYPPKAPNGPTDMCGPVALRFTIRRVPQADYAVEVLSREAER